MFILPKLDYSYDALEPYIDKETMIVHHDKHHQSYTDNLNSALTDFPELQKKDAEEILKNISDIPDDIRTKVINNGGGFINHSLFWKFMNPTKSSPSGELLNSLNVTFSNLDNFKERLTDTAMSQFGSGWGWLVFNSGNLEIVNTANQNSPISEGKIPILGIDVWEHAYYLKYKNKRLDYIKAWWNIVNWDYVSDLYTNVVRQ